MAKITAVDENVKVEDATVEETVTPVEDVVVEPEETIDSDFSVDNTEESYDEDVMPLPSDEEDATPVYNGDVAQQSSETIGKKWNEYTTGTDLDDTDELMILDTSAKANKRTLLSKLADYVLGKLADKVFEKLETQNKTILGALNELNSKKALEINSAYVDQSNIERKLQFSGITRSRTVVALLLISSQLEAAQPICISFSDTDVSTAQAYVSSNAIGATGGKNGTITIPRFAGGWGTYRIVFLDKGLSVKAIV